MVIASVLAHQPILVTGTSAAGTVVACAATMNSMPRANHVASVPPLVLIATGRRRLCQTPAKGATLVMQGQDGSISLLANGRGLLTRFPVYVPRDDTMGDCRSTRDGKRGVSAR